VYRRGTFARSRLQRKKGIWILARESKRMRGKKFQKERASLLGKSANVTETVRRAMR